MASFLGGARSTVLNFDQGPLEDPGTPPVSLGPTNPNPRLHSRLDFSKLDDPKVAFLMALEVLLLDEARRCCDPVTHRNAGASHLPHTTL